MLLSDRPRSHYDRAPAHEVICQLRFPSILSIEADAPARFQDQIRRAFPQYARRQDVLPPKISRTGNDVRVETPPAVINHHFLSEDGKWKLNLTKDFIALSTLRYPGWEEFARRLDRPLASFIQIYAPAWFQRVGLRYRNLVSRERLGLEGVPWSELFAPAYTGLLREEDVREEDVLGWGADLAFRLGASCQAKIHTGPGRIQSSGGDAPANAERCFLLDLDLSMEGETPCGLAAAALETLHAHADRVFEGAVTDRLRDAMRGGA